MLHGIGRVPAADDVQPLLHVVLVFVPRAGDVRYFVLTNEECQGLREQYRTHTLSLGRSYRDDFGGFNWSAPQACEDCWDKLPP
jgi:hypothetical protein